MECATIPTNQDSTLITIPLDILKLMDSITTSIGEAKTTVSVHGQNQRVATPTIPTTTMVVTVTTIMETTTITEVDSLIS